MKTEHIYKERKRRFALLIRRYKNQVEAANALGFGSPAAVSNLKNGYDNIGTDVALRIEQLAELGAGMMVSPLSTPWTGESNTIQKKGLHSSVNDPEREYVFTNTEFADVKIDTYESWIADGSARDCRMSVSKKWLSAEGFDSSQIKSITMPDNSQLGFVSKGYEIAINVNWGTKLRNDLFYAIDIGGSITLRKVEHRASGGLHLRCLNPDYRDESLTQSEADSLDVKGVAVLCQFVFPK